MNRRAATAIVAAVAVAALSSAAQAATISIPSIHVRTKVTANLDAGPAWWPGTHRPGVQGTVAIAGHRTTHTRPFHDLDKLRAGDRINVWYDGRLHAYTVTSRAVISASNLHIADDVGHERLILSACARRDGSPTSAAYRIVVYALPIRGGETR